MITDEKKRALRQYLSMPDDEEDDFKLTQWDENTISSGDREYLVLTDMEADDYARKEIENSLWAFQANFILSHCSTYEDMSNWEFDAAKEALGKIQGHFCESINPLIKAMIPNMDEFIEDAICADGRGAFLSHYDGRENEEEIDGVTYYIYEN